MRTRLPLSVALVVVLVSACSSSRQADLVISAATVVDVQHGTTTPGLAIVVRDGRIVAVTTDASAYAPATALDAAGAFVMPGLWDNHVHFGGGAALIEENRNLLPLYLVHGITTVRDAAGDLSASVLEWRAQVADGSLLGPTIFTSGPKLEGIDSIWPGDLEVGSEGDVRAALDRLQAMRVDFVKITENTLTPALYLYGLAEARRRGFVVSAHVPVALTLDHVSEAGLGSIEHMSYLLRGGSPREAELSGAVAAGRLAPAKAVDAMIDSFDEVTALATFRRLAARRTAVTPTLNGSRILAYLDQDSHAADDYLKYIGPGVRRTYEGRVTRAATDDAAAVARRHARFERSAALVPLLQRAGVTILAGTDAGFLNSFNYPGIGLHQELALLVKSGLTPQQALAASVVNGPTFMRAAEGYGAVATGKVADLLILAGNPLDDIAATRSIQAVVVKGRVLDRPALDRMLAEVASRVAAAPPP